MEETEIVQIVTIFFSSNQIEELSIQLYDSRDEQLVNVNLKNYTTHSLRLCLQKTSFYCVATSVNHNIEEQFDCDFTENENENDKMTIVKAFTLFKVKIESEIVTEYKVVTDQNSPQSQQATLYAIAGKNLKKLEQKIIKKIEVDQLARPIQTKTKRSQLKNNYMKKSKTNFMMKDHSRENSAVDKLQERSEKKATTIKCFNQSAISEDQAEEIKQREMAVLVKRGAKHKTYMPQLCRNSEAQSVHKQPEVQKKEPEIPQYQRLFRAINGTACRFSVKKRNLRNTYGSVVEELEKETKKDLHSQKQFMDLVRDAVVNLNSTSSTTTSRPSSRIQLRGIKSTTGSPYKCRPGIARKKKKFL